MNSEFHRNPTRSGHAPFPPPRRPTAAAAMLGLACLVAAPLRAEDPLLGRIKVIQCVGCDPGAVNLLVHDPIDVRDFEVQIKESDYQKIVTPLAGKTVYDKGECFYWVELPKTTGKKAVDPKGSARPGPAGYSPGPAGDSLGAPSPKGAEMEKTGAGKTLPASGETASAPAPPPEAKPSRCVPYVRLKAKPANPDAGRGNKEE